MSRPRLPRAVMVTTILATVPMAAVPLLVSRLMAWAMVRPAQV